MMECVGLRYFRIWRAAVGLLATIGLIASLVFVAPALGLAAFLIAAATAGAIYLSWGLGHELSSGELIRSTPRWGVIGGLIMLAICGYGASVGPETVVLLGLVVASSPPVAARLWPRLAMDATSRPQLSAAPSPRRVVVHSPRRSASPPVALSPPVDWPMPRYLAAVARSLCQLSDQELCLAWRRSFKQLQSATGADQRSAMADVRRAYLDELERRRPDAFVSWIASGARAASDPARFFIHRAQHHDN